MFKVDKNEKSFKELADYANEVKLPLKTVLLSDEHLDKVSAIFYKSLPKVVKMAMKEPKFKLFYQEHREQLISQIDI